MENNLLAASEGVEICSVAFRNLCISNAEYNYDIIFLENDINFFPMFYLSGEAFLIVSHCRNIMVVCC